MSNIKEVLYILEIEIIFRSGNSKVIELPPVLSRERAGTLIDEISEKFEMNENIVLIDDDGTICINSTLVQLMTMRIKEQIISENPVKINNLE